MQDDLTLRRLSLASQDESIAMQITVRRTKSPPFYSAEMVKYPQNPTELLAVANMLKLAIEKMINDNADATGFATKIQP